MSKQSVAVRGSLTVVSTPIGNAEDLSLRALRVLREADLVAAEDTRAARRLLAFHGISRPLISYHDWNEARRTETLLRLAGEGKRIALISEAGTPGLSDPGYDVVRAARQEGLPVSPVPGPSALTAFLSVCGLPTNAFSFFGFPPNRKAARRALFSRLAERPETLVFFESPRRTVEALGDALEIFGERECALGREMTKPHEEFLFSPLSSVLSELRGRAKVLGEVCWGVRGFLEGAREPDGDSFEEAVQLALEGGVPPRAAAKDLARRFRVSAKAAYAALVADRARLEPPPHFGGTKGLPSRRRGTPAP